MSSDVRWLIVTILIVAMIMLGLKIGCFSFSLIMLVFVSGQMISALLPNPRLSLTADEIKAAEERMGKKFRRGGIIFLVISSLCFLVMLSWILYVSRSMGADAKLLWTVSESVYAGLAAVLTIFAANGYLLGWLWYSDKPNFPVNAAWINYRLARGQLQKTEPSSKTGGGQHAQKADAERAVAQKSDLQKQDSAESDLSKQDSAKANAQASQPEKRPAKKAKAKKSAANRAVPEIQSPQVKQIEEAKKQTPADRELADRIRITVPYACYLGAGLALAYCLQLYTVFAADKMIVHGTVFGAQVEHPYNEISSVARLGKGDEAPFRITFKDGQFWDSTFGFRVHNPIFPSYETDRFSDIVLKLIGHEKIDPLN